MRLPRAEGEAAPTLDRGQRSELYGGRDRRCRQGRQTDEWSYTNQRVLNNVLTWLLALAESEIRS